MSDAVELAQEANDLAAAARVNEFLADPAIQAWMKHQDRLVFDEFKLADSDEKRRDAWSKACAFQTLLDGIDAIKTNGKFAAHKKALREPKSTAPRS